MKLFLSFLILLFSGLVSAADPILVFGNESKPPKIWREQGVNKGILTAILKATEKELGVDFQVRTFPWKRAVYNAESGKGAIVGFSMTHSRLEEFDFSAPLYYDKVVLVVKKGEEFTFDRYEDLQGKTIGNCLGCTFGPRFEAAKRFFNIQEDHNNIGRLKKLLTNRLDAAILSSGRKQLEQLCAENSDLNIEDFSILAKPLALDPNYLAFSKSMHMKEFLSSFNLALASKRQSGEIQAIIDRYTK